MYTIESCLINTDTICYEARVIVYFVDCDKPFLVQYVLPLLEKLAKVKSLDFIKEGHNLRVVYIATHVEQRGIANIRWHINSDIKSSVNRYNYNNPKQQIELSDYQSVFCKGKTTNNNEGEYIVHGDSE